MRSVPCTFCWIHPVKVAFWLVTYIFAYLCPQISVDAVFGSTANRRIFDGACFLKCVDQLVNTRECDNCTFGIESVELSSYISLWLLPPYQDYLDAFVFAQTHRLHGNLQQQRFNDLFRKSKLPNCLLFSFFRNP